MTARDFCFWLQGYLELTANETLMLKESQVQCVQKHLALVFKHEIDPSFGKDNEALNVIHNKPPFPPDTPVMRC